MNLRPHARPWKPLALVPVVAILAAACASNSGGSPSFSPTDSQSPPGSTSTETPDPPSTAPTETVGADVTLVTIRSRSFGAAEITVAVGDVTFTNADSLPHTVTEGENGAASGGARFDEVVDSDATIVISFMEPGDYRITCQFHPEMHLLVHAH